MSLIFMLYCTRQGRDVRRHAEISYQARHLPFLLTTSALFLTSEPDSSFYENDMTAIIEMLPL